MLAVIALGFTFLETDRGNPSALSLASAVLTSTHVSRVATGNSSLHCARMTEAVDSSLGFWDIAAASVPAFLRPIRVPEPDLAGADDLRATGVDWSLQRWLLDGLHVASGYQDVAAAVWALSLIIWGLWLSDNLTRRKIIGSKFSRKLLHILIGLVYMLFCWPLFSSHPDARFVAATAPVVTACRLLLIGLGLASNDGMIRSMSRGGGKSELLVGPLCYAVAILAITVVFWRNSPVGIVALVALCAGDGIADVWGRKHGHRKLPWNRRKSWAGSLAMLLLGTVLSNFYVLFFCLLGHFSCPHSLPSTSLRILLVNLGATVVESLPIGHIVDDNVTVPVTAVLLGNLLLAPRG